MKAFLTLAILAHLVICLPIPRRSRVDDRAETGMWAGGWYPGWYSDKFPPSKIPWDKYTALTYSFAVTTENPGELSLPDPESVLQDFVSQAHDHNVKALLSVGGWTGSQHFSTAVRTADSRSTFVGTLLDYVDKYKLDGLDFDWEYPNSEGAGNEMDGSDTANFLELLKELRSKVPDDFQLTAAVAMTPFNGPDGQPLSDVSEFADVLDHIAIMAYDVYGTFSIVGAGPNAPLQDSCAPEKNQLGSGASAVEAWTGAGFPASKILLGVASYGRGYVLDKGVVNNDPSVLGSYPDFAQGVIPPGTGETGNPTSSNTCGGASGVEGVFDYGDLVAKGLISSDGTASKDLLYYYDKCTETPYLYNPSSEVMISYDDPTSFRAKAEFISKQGLAGFSMWHIASDSEDNTLLNTILGG